MHLHINVYFGRTANYCYMCDCLQYGITRTDQKRGQESDN